MLQTPPTQASWAFWFPLLIFRSYFWRKKIKSFSAISHFFMISTVKIVLYSKIMQVVIIGINYCGNWKFMYQEFGYLYDYLWKFSHWQKNIQTLKNNSNIVDIVSWMKHPYQGAINKLRFKKTFGNILGFLRDIKVCLNYYLNFLQTSANLSNISILIIDKSHHHEK